MRNRNRPSERPSGETRGDAIASNPGGLPGPAPTAAAGTRAVAPSPPRRTNPFGVSTVIHCPERTQRGTLSPVNSGSVGPSNRDASAVAAPDTFAGRYARNANTDPTNRPTDAAATAIDDVRDLRVAFPTSVRGSDGRRRIDGDVSVPETTASMSRINSS